MPAERNASEIIVPQKLASALTNKVALRGGDLSTALSLLNDRLDEFELETNTVAEALASVYHTNAGLIVPKDGRIYPILVPVVVDESRPWQEAVEAIGKQARFRDDTTSPTDLIWEAGARFPPEAGAKPAPKMVILVCFGQASNNPEWMKEITRAWASKNRVRTATPRTILAVAEQLPCLYRQLGTVHIISPHTSSSLDEDRLPDWYSVEVILKLSAPVAHLRFIGNSFPAFRATDMFAFVREDTPAE